MMAQPPPPAYPGPESKAGGPYPGTEGKYGEPSYSSSIPPAAGYQPMYGQPAPPPQYGVTTHVVVQPSYAVTQAFREVAVRTKCPSCQSDILTSTHYETGTFVWIIAGILCIFGLWLGCCLIPFCMNGCKDVVHSCPQCRHQIARYTRM